MFRRDPIPARDPTPQSIRLPEKLAEPDAELLRFHRDQIFKG
jgi:hypothetical protein